MPRTAWRWLQGIAGAAIVVFLIIRIRRDWGEIWSQPIAWQIRWQFVVASLLVTWAMYAVLVWGWRTVLRGWGQRLRAFDAARIWTVSSLGKYIPGKVWAIAGMAMMAQQEGISGAAATGSAIIMQLLSIATGAGIALALTGSVILRKVWGGPALGIAVALAALVAAVSLTSPSVTRRLGLLVRRPEAVRPVDPRSLAGAIGANLVAWAGYGLALKLLAAGTMPTTHLGWATAAGAFAGSYIGGYLMLFLPGGLGVREALLVLLLRDVIGEGPAIALSAVSRVTLTVNELGAAVPFLLMRRKSSET